MQSECENLEQLPALPAASETEVRPTEPVVFRGSPPSLRGWLVPAALSPNPDEARARIQLPEFDAVLVDKARVISGFFPVAEAEYRYLCVTEPSARQLDIPHFERVFLIAITAKTGTCRLRRR